MYCKKGNRGYPSTLVRLLVHVNWSICLSVHLSIMSINTSDTVRPQKKTKSAVRAIPCLLRARVQRPVSLHDLQKVLSLFLVARDGAAERADEGDAPLRKVVHHP